MALHKIDDNTWLTEKEYQEKENFDLIKNLTLFIPAVILLFLAASLLDVFIAPVYGLMTIFSSWIAVPSWLFWTISILGTILLWYIATRNGVLALVTIVTCLILGYLLFDNYMVAYPKVFPEGNWVHESAELSIGLLKSVFNLIRDLLK